MNNPPSPGAPAPILRRRPAMVAALLALLLAGAGESDCRAAENAGPASRPSAVEPQPPGKLAPYAAFGSAVALQMRMSELNWSEAQFAAFVSGLRAAYLGQPYPPEEATQRLSDEVDQRIKDLQTRPARAADSSPDPVEQYMREARQGLKMQQTDSGLLYVIMQAGAGPRPRPVDTIVVSFTAVAADGKTELPRLAARKLRIKVADLLPGLAEGIQLVALGGRAVFVVPPKLSFASGQWPVGVDAGTPLIFRVELEDITAKGAAP